jgi:hypothetical protein
MKDKRSDETKDWLYIINYYIPELQYKCTSKTGFRIPIQAPSYIVTSTTGQYQYTPGKFVLSNEVGKLGIFLHFKNKYFPKARYPYFCNSWRTITTFQESFYRFLLSRQLYESTKSAIHNVPLKDNGNALIKTISTKCYWGLESDTYG